MSPHHVETEKRIGELKESLVGVFRTPLFSIELCFKGKTHDVFKIRTERGTYILKGFRRKDATLDRHHEKLILVNDLLERAGIPHARIFAYSEGNELFPNGYVIQEWLDGRNFEDMIYDGTIKEATFLEWLGRTLKKIHEIQFSEYGSVNPLILRRQNFGEWKGYEAGDLVSAGIDEKTAERVRERIYEFRRLEPKFKPVLVHNDARSLNCIMNPERGMVLIDWDEAFAGPWLKDLSHVIYTGVPLEKGDKEEKFKIRAFIKGYGKTNLTFEEIREGLHILQLIETQELIGSFSRMGDRRAVGFLTEKLFSFL